MKQGKISQIIQKRSVINLIKYKGKYRHQMPKLDEVCVGVHKSAGDIVVSTMTCISGNQADVGIFAITRVVNDLLCRGAEPTGVQAMIQLHEGVSESHLKNMVQAMEEYCQKIQVPLLNVQVDVSPTLSIPQVIITGLGETTVEFLESRENTQANMDIVMIGEVGLEGGLRLLSEKGHVLAQRFSSSFLRGLGVRSGEMRESGGAIKAAIGFGEGIIYQVPEGGILAGLWELGESVHTGMEVQLKSLPISQEVIEVCEYLSVNPYRLGGAGSILLLSNNGEQLVEEMTDMGYKGVVIGKTTDTNERILCNNDDIRHLERPTCNELYKVLP